MKKLLFFLFLQGALWGAEFQTSIELSKNKITLDENLIIEAVFSYPENFQVDTNTLRANLLKYSNFTHAPFSLAVEKIIKQEEGKLTIQYTLEPMVTGIHFISLYNIPFTSKDEKFEIISDIFTVEVTLPPPLKDYQPITYSLISLTDQIPIEMDRALSQKLFENPKLNDLEAKKNVTHMQKREIPITRIIAVLILIIIFLIARQYPKEKPSLEKEIALKFFRSKKQAQSAFESLLQRKFVVQKKYDQHFIDLNSTLRKFFEERLQIEATTKTSEEIIEELSIKKAFDKKTFTELEEFLEKSDLIKFAEYQPSQNECDKANDIAKRIFY